MIVKIICYLSRIVYSFIADLDAVNFFAPFSCYVDNFLVPSQVLKRLRDLFEEIYFPGRGY